MWWLWILGPVVVAVIYFLTAGVDKRRLRELELWRASWGPTRAGKPIGARRVGLPTDLGAMLEQVGGGQPLGVFELVAKEAYLAVYAPTPMTDVEHQTVFLRLDAPVPALTARPLPIVDGARMPNTGIVFAKDADFSAAYLVEGIDAKGVKKWLSPPLREQLCELPDLWIRAQSRTAAVTFYGAADADRLDDLVAAADVVFAEYGAVDASLLGDAAALPPEEPEKPAKKGKHAKPGKVARAEVAHALDRSKAPKP
jgi:hypothetical protein